MEILPAFCSRVAFWEDGQSLGSSAGTQHGDYVSFNLVPHAG